MNNRIAIILLSGMAYAWVFIGIVLFLGVLGESIGFPVLGVFLGIAIAFTVTYLKGVTGK